MIRNKTFSGIVLLVIAVTIGGILFLLSTQNHKRKTTDNFEKKVSAFETNSGGMNRKYFVYVPSDAEDMSLAVVLAFHGGGGPIGSAELMAERSGWKELAEKEKFLAVFPQGTVDDPKKPVNLTDDPVIERNIITWSDGSQITFASRRGVDDIGYVRDILSDLEARFKIDKRRIFATGFSNGATMTYRLGVDLSDIIAAIAPVAGLLYIDKPLKQPVSLINIVGDKDKPPETKKASAVKEMDPGTRISNPVSVWARYLSCPGDDKKVIETEDWVSVGYGPCDGDSEVLTYSVKSLGHVYPGLSLYFKADPGFEDKFYATDAIWEFFKKRSKSRTGLML
jgi:polyhydroxybutyrate depolymerase